ncbi:MAG: hypothetical protein M3070_17050, partial [Actinomycetota bacterium]|nr:hypothetical protein [Actinomycetota bacterium]
MSDAWPGFVAAREREGEVVRASVGAASRGTQRSPGGEGPDVGTVERIDADLGEQRCRLLE